MSTDTTQAATSGDTSAAFGAELFAPNTLPTLESFKSASRHLTAATKILLELVQTRPLQDTPNPLLGRFSLETRREAVAQNRAVLRLLRLSVDFLEADLTECENEEIAYLESELEAIRAARRSQGGR